MQNVLSVSQDRMIESILQCIPLFCIGIMALGSFTVLLVLRRVNLGEIYLYSSPFLAFVAVILNLGLILAQNVTETTDTSFSRGLTIAREVCLSLSLGFHFLFYWSLVGQCPHHEQSSRSSSMCAHSASWEQWGFLGLVLKWSLLSLALAIAILQVIWRITTPAAQFRIIYTTEATIEIIVSSLFLLKLLLNIYISPLSSWGRRVKPCIVPFCALLISAGIGAGNLVNQVFSETTLGRFLRAVEFYIIIVQNMISAFSDIPSVDFQSYSEKQQAPIVDSQVNVTKSVSSLPIRHSTASVVLRNPTSIFLDESRWPSRVSKLSWVIPRDFKPVKQDLESAVPQRVSRADSESNRPLTMAYVQVTPVGSRPSTNMSLSSHYTMKGTSTTLYRIVRPDVNWTDLGSPVYGLNGIERGKHFRQNNSLGELFRQQNELDKSIAALGILSSQSTGTQDPNSATSAFLQPNESGDSGPLSPNSLQRKHESDSNRSDFSLSNFPEPPPAIMDDARASVVFAGRTSHRRPPPMKQGIGLLSGSDGDPLFPVSRTEVGEAISSSLGRQHDITSVIGGVTVPKTVPVASVVPHISQSGDDGPSDAAMRQDNGPLLLRPF